MFKASLVASAVFAIAWFRMPPSTMVLRYFVGYGIFIIILSMIVGMPIVAWLVRRKTRSCWSYLAFAAATGALLGAILSSHPTISCVKPETRNGEQETCIENPFAITFSPWTRSKPLFAENPSIQWRDYVGTIAFGAVIGATLGLSFWFFYYQRRKTEIDAHDDHSP
jgi:hypothetical protein